MADSSETIVRLLQILHTTDQDNPLNARQIMTIMEEKYRQKMSRDTVYAEIKTLRFCGYDIKNCTNKNQGYYMDKHEFENWQLKIMLDAIAQARCLTWKESHDLQKKLLGMTSSGGVRKLAMPYAPPGRNKPQMHSTGPFIDTIMDAVYRGVRIEFRYTELDENMNRVLRRNGEYYELSVYSLYWSKNIYYIIGGHEKHRSDRTLTNYRLDRIEDIRLSEKTMIPMKEFLGDSPEQKLQKYIDEQVDHYAGEPMHFTIEFDPKPRNMAVLADFAGYDIWLNHMPNGRVRASMTRQDSPALRGWLLRYADEFRIISPPSLRQEIVGRMEEVLSHYKEDDQTPKVVE